MRVIRGIYKRRRFDVPHTFKARPTTDFAKENLFNVLSNYIDFEDGVTALDLFAGTGSISIELVSRGCDRVISVEKDPQHYAFIRKVMEEVKTDKCFPVRGDVFRYMERCHEQFDFIFADPPYALSELPTIPERRRIVCSGTRKDTFFRKSSAFCGTPPLWKRKLLVLQSRGDNRRTTDSVTLLFQERLSQRFFDNSIQSR